MGICSPTDLVRENFHRFTTLVDVSRWHARGKADAPVYIYLQDGEDDELVLTYGDLDRQARAVAARLQQVGATGQRALLVYEPGLDYIVAFYGCLYAGVVAVPAYPLDPLRVARTLPRLQAIVGDARAAFALTSRSMLGWSEHLLRQTGDFDSVIATDGLRETLADEWVEPDIGGETLAFLQYTSGSTGSPKGVMLSHENLMHNLGQLDALDSQGTRGVCWLPPYHDMGLIGNILLPAFRGKDVVLMSPLAFVQRPIRWLRAISRYRGSSSGSPNFGYDLCVRKIRDEECRELDLSCWNMAFNGAEPVRQQTMQRFSKKFAPYGFDPAAFCPCYGLAEATLFVTGGVRRQLPHVERFNANALANHRAVGSDDRNGDGRTLASSGRVNGDQTVRIVDPETCLACLDDAIGEIWISSPSVSRGYWNRHDESIATFQAYLRETGEGPFLRTGDLGFLRRGELFVTGRIKDLLIIGGRNLYPQDIEATVQQCHEALKLDGGAAFSVEADDREQLVVVQEILRPRKWDLDELIHRIREAVFAEHEVAVDAVILIKPATLPKTTSGKVQRRACREQFLKDQLRSYAAWHAKLDTGALPTSKQQGAEPRGATEAALVKLWTEVFGTNEVDRHDNFFDIGGHSLLAMQLISRVRETFGVDLPLRRLFESPTLAAMAAVIEEIGPRPGHQAFQPKRTIAAEMRQPLSFAQQRLWLLDRLESEATTYNIAAQARLRGVLDLAALEASLAELVRRHAPLRATFEIERGIPFQHLSQNSSPTIDFTDLRPVSPNRREAELQRIADEHFSARFDLRRGPLLRCRVIRLADDEHRLLLALHHIAADGWSMNLLALQWSTLYEARVTGQTAPRFDAGLQYRDYVAWQRQRLDQGLEQQQLAYWTRQLSGLTPLALPLDRSRRDEHHFHGDAVETSLPPALVKSLTTLAHGEGGTLYMVLLAAFNVLLHRYTGQTDIGIGSPIAGRTHKPWENVVGLFANTLLLRTSLAGDPTFRMLLGRVREASLDGFAHQDLPFDKIVQALHPEREQTHTPLFNVFFALEELPEQLPQGGQMRVERIEAEYRYMVPVELSLFVERHGDGLRMVMVYDTGLFDQSTARRMLDSLELLLGAAADNVDRRLAELLPITPADDKQLAQWNQTESSIPADACLHDLFTAQAQRTPDAFAIEYEGKRLTYAELDCRSNQLARYLRDRGARPDRLVGIYLDRSLEMVIALLGVLKSGSAYVPLDPIYPRKRIEAMIADAAVDRLITQQRLAGDLDGTAEHLVRIDTDWPAIACYEETPLRRTAEPTDLAYTIYTSGSTGKPKGVEIPHRAVVNFLDSMSREPGLSARDTMLAVTTLSFDIAVLELFLPLVVGARVIIAPRQSVRDTAALAALISRSGATVMQATPATWRMLLDAAWQPDAKLKVLCGGEALDRCLAARLRAAGGEVWNLYGPTETTVWSTLQRIDNTDGTIPIGRPIGNTQVYVLDDHRRPVPNGAVGELYIAGHGLARGYRNRPELTAQRFLPSGRLHDHGARMYRTGDLARFRSDGSLDFLGRIDHQVKLRGYRIELSEIEHVLRQHVDVRDAVVMAHEYGPGDTRLVAYVTSRASNSFNVTQLKAHASEQLPQYMVPTSCVLLEELPRTPNGKIDRRALPDPGRGAAVGLRKITPPGDEIERRMADIWRDLLGLEEVGIDDNFFDLGGHSMLAVRLMAGIENRCGTHVPLACLFQRPTIKKLAELVRRGGTNHSREVLVPIQTTGTRRPLFCMHPAGGTVFCYLALARQLGADQPLYGLQAQGVDGEGDPHDSVESMASRYVQAIRHVQPQGPYQLAGWSLGGVVAFEMARQLESAGQSTDLLCVFDSLMMSPQRPFDDHDIVGLLVEMLPGDDALSLAEVRKMDDLEQMKYFRGRAERARLVMPDSHEQRLHRVFEVFEGNLQSMFRYRPQAYEGQVTVFRAMEHVTPMFMDTQLGWQHWARGGVEVFNIPCQHLQILQEPFVKQVAQTLKARLETVACSQSGV